MKEFNSSSKQYLNKTQTSVLREYSIDGKNYIVTSIFIGEKDLKTTLLNLAEKKAIKEMGFDCIIT